jgi:hypothetical protein
MKKAGRKKRKKQFKVVFDNLRPNWTSICLLLSCRTAGESAAGNISSPLWKRLGTNLKFSGLTNVLGAETMVG